MFAWGPAACTPCCLCQMQRKERNTNYSLYPGTLCCGRDGDLTNVADMCHKSIGIGFLTWVRGIPK